MPGKSFVARLTTAQRDQFNAEIRARHYCECAGLAQWLQAKFGVKTAKSAVQKYTASLKAADGVQGIAGSAKALASMSKAHGAAD